MVNKILSSNVLDSFMILDGATGTELVKKGMPNGVAPELWILENQQYLFELQQKYIEAGSTVITVPSLGANRCKMEEFGFTGSITDLNRDLSLLSKKAADGRVLVYGNISGTGRFVEPFGDLPFEECVSIFKEQVLGFIEAGVDGVIIETLLDLQEARAALLAVTENSSLPALVCLSYDESGRTLGGTTPQAALLTLQSMGAAAVGCNCSTGPEEMIELIASMKQISHIPLIAMPNAGLPRLENGRTVFSMGPEEFGLYADKFYEAGAAIIGGCCGTTPDHIKQVISTLNGKKPKSRNADHYSAVSSYREVAFIGKDNFSVIGERINPTGKKSFQTELREESLASVLRFAVEQKQNGASLLDVNMGLSGIDEADMMKKSVNLLSKQSPLPLCIDSTRPEVIEQALRIYPGRALVNSISAERERIEKTLPVAAKYGAMFILLPLDDSGIPKTFKKRKVVTETIIKEADKYGYTLNDIVVDGLVMTVSSDQSAARTTLDLISWCAAEMGLNTTCGLSNVSFGLPERKWVNTAFLALAANAGLSMAIANPSSRELQAMVSEINKQGINLKAKRVS